MKTKFPLWTLHLSVLLLSTLSYQSSTSFAQGTAFTYQGRLTVGTNVANGTYDLRFALYDAATLGAQQGGALTNSPTAVSNGLFLVTLNFGNQFPGADRWLEIAVRTNGGGAFTALLPRQALTATPYAVRAANFSGTVAGSQLTGTYGNAVTFNNAGNSFTGSGAGLTALNASQLTNGTVADARLSANVSLLGASIESGEISDGTILNVDINSSAAIADTKLATIATGGKVANSATTATNANNPNAIVARDASGNFSAGTVSASNFIGTVSAAQLSGAIPSANVAGTYSGAVTFNNAGNSFTGNGAGLTSLNAGNIASGTLSDARLSANAALRAGGNVFTGNQTLNPAVGVEGLTINGSRSGNFSTPIAFIQNTNAGSAGPALRLLGTGNSVDGVLNVGATGGGKIIAFGGVGGEVANMDTSGNLFFGSTTRQMLNLWGAVYGIGVQNNTLYARSDGGFAWFRDGVHTNNTFDPGPGGATLMVLTDTGNLGIGMNNPQSALHVNGAVTANAFAGNWQEVTGTTQQAVPNRGYLANNAVQVTITLPASPAVGDVIRVSGVGAGGWKIAQNSGQSIRGASLGLGVNWTPRESNRNWSSIASSSDGTKLVAAVSDIVPGQIYTSTDSGVNWTPRESNRVWWSVASSADGSKLAAVVYDGQIYTSTDSGVNWTPRQSNREWRSIASSSDGSKLVAGVQFGQIYTSTDSGVNWTPRESIRNWTSVASSSDGTKLVAVADNGQIYTSTDSGVNWTPRESDRDWTSVASSSDGSKLVAAETGGQIYTSTDSGVNWTPHEINRNWNSVASSADGSKLVAVVLNGQIYTSNADTSPGTGGYLTGSQSTAIELQYIGNDQFMPISHEGTINFF